MKTYQKIILVILIILILLGVRYGITLRRRMSKSVTSVKELTFESQVKRSIEKGLSWIGSNQSTDGAWRSETYGLMKSGQSMTPFTLYGLTQSINGEIPKKRKREIAGQIQRGLKFLIDQINQDGSVGTRGIQEYPTYSTALSAIVLSRLKPDNWQEKVNLMVRYLKAQQLTEELGWNESDSEYGGWGNDGWIQKPSEPMPQVIKDIVVDRVDLSHTVFVLEALKAGNLSLDDMAWGKALIFLKKCQNFSEDKTLTGAGFYNGGFIFVPNSILGNKAGPFGKDENGLVHYRSYGSMTADGVRALLFCGVNQTEPRFQSGLKWVENNFRIDEVPGFTTEPQPPWSKGVIFYYYWSMSRLFDELKLSRVNKDNSKINWSKEVAIQLLQLQNNDGSWINQIGLMKENDPLISTNFALMTLGYCLHTVRNE